MCVTAQRSESLVAQRGGGGSVGSVPCCHAKSLTLATLREATFGGVDLWGAS